MVAMSMFALWEETNQTVFSSVFNVPVGYCCILYAANLKEHRYRESADVFDYPQVFCVKRLVHEFKPVDKRNLPCNWIFVTDESLADEVVDQIVTTCTGSWQLSPCNNIGIIGLPGTYRLELNDPTAIGDAQAYAELVDASKIPMQIKELFFC